MEGGRKQRKWQHLVRVIASFNMSPSAHPSSLIILGIDPGFDRTGFGLITHSGMAQTWMTHGCIQTHPGLTFAERIIIVKQELKKLLDLHKPDCVAVEDLFFSNNAKTAVKVGMARGVIILTIAEAGIPIVELTPNQVKQGLTGYGAADKRQVQDMVQRSLKLKERPTPDDAADALAIAMVGAYVYKQKTLLK